MLEKNSLPFGLMLGIIIPLLGYLLLTGIYQIFEMMEWVSDSGFRPMFRERTTAIIALGLNAIALNFYQKRYLNNTMRGIVIVTAVWVVLWLVKFGKYVL